MTDNETKSIIISLIWEKCAKPTDTKLPEYIRTDDVLRAINLDEYYFKEETQ